MGRFVKGEVVVLPFPFSDLSNTKRRPALVVAPLPSNDVILCMITSKNTSDADAVPLTGADFQSGSLRKDSNIRPNRLFTAEESIVLYSVGQLHGAKIAEVTARLVHILRR